MGWDTVRDIGRKGAQPLHISLSKTQDGTAGVLLHCPPIAKEKSSHLWRRFIFFYWVFVIDTHRTILASKRELASKEKIHRNFLSKYFLDARMYILDSSSQFGQEQRFITSLKTPSYFLEIEGRYARRQACF